jgi:hypothetical protein
MRGRFDRARGEEHGPAARALDDRREHGGGTLLGMIVEAGIEVVVAARARGRDGVERIEAGAEEMFKFAWDHCLPAAQLSN